MVSQKKREKVLWLAGFFILGAVRDAHAYLDPGSGSYMFQIIMATLLGAGYVIKVYWRKILLSIRSLFSRKEK